MKPFCVSIGPARFKANPAVARLAFGCLALILLAPVASRAENVSLDSCPDPVKATILPHLREGRLEDIKRLEVEDRVLYLVEIDLKGFREITLHVNGTGILQKSVEEIRQPDLPVPVRDALARILGGKGRAKDFEKVVTVDRIEYRVEVERPKVKDVVYIFAVDGTLLGQK